MHPDSHFLPVPDGPSSLDYSKMKTPESTWTDPTAYELVQRHRIYSSPNMSHNLKPLLARRKRLFTISGTQSQPSLNGIPSVAREHVDSLHQNAVTTLLYGKNNVELSLVSLNYVFFEKQPLEVVYCIPAGNYMFKVNNRNTRTRCVICSKLTIKTPERR